MQIFLTNTDPSLAALDLDDRRLVKACLETAQLLSTALYRRNISNLRVYRPAEEHHPCSVWAAASRNNFRWLYHYGKALCAEYTFRFVRKHGSSVIMDNCWEIFNNRKEVFPVEGLTPWCNLTPYKDTTWDVEECYRLYLINHKWGPLTVWSKRSKPDWYRTKFEQIASDELEQQVRKVAGG